MSRPLERRVKVRQYDHTLWLWLKVILSDERSFSTDEYPGPERGLAVSTFLHDTHFALTRSFILPRI